MPPVTVNDLNNAKLDCDTIGAAATSSAPTVTDRLGNTKNTLSGMNAAVLASAAAVQGSIGYLPPLVYAAGINLTLAAQTVNYSGQTYAPLLSALPFTTSGTFETAKFRLIQGVSSADLAAPTGAAMVGANLYQTQASVNQERISVHQFGAKGDGVTDDTAAFSAAIATGKTVTVPYTTSGYVINNLTTITNMVIVGEKSGVSNGPTLIITQNNAGAFLTTTQVFQIEICNFSIRAAVGVTGARAYKQLDKSYYTAYAKFSNIETSSSLLVSYDLFPIFSTWSGCRDGYIDAAQAQGHQAINAIPATWDQGNQCNMNRFVDTQFFGCNGSSMAGTSAFVATVDCAYGEIWGFENCDFEGLSIAGFRGRGITRAAFKSCHAEGIAAPANFTADITPSNPIGTTLSFSNCTIALQKSLGQFCGIGAACSVSLENTSFTQIAAGVVLTGSPTAISKSLNISVTGPGAVGFLAGVNTTTDTGGKTLINQAVDNGSGSIIQLKGAYSASSGFTSLYNKTVSTSPITLGVPQLTGGIVFVNGFNTSGGNSGWWLVAWNANALATTLSAVNNTGLTVTFTVVAGSLCMNTISGTLQVNCSVLV